MEGMKPRFHKGILKSLRRTLKEHEIKFLLSSLESFERILPHTEVSRWTKKIGRDSAHKVSKAWWQSLARQQRRAIGLQLHLPGKDWLLVSSLRRKKAGVGVGDISRVLDDTEMRLCKRILSLASNRLNELQSITSISLALQLTRSFDDNIVLEHLKDSHQLEFSLEDLVDFLRQLSEQSYENKSLSFGVLIDKDEEGTLKNNKRKVFPRDYLAEKKFRAFTDGYRSAYLLDRFGAVKGLVDLEENASQGVKGKHYYPQWSENMALSSLKNVIGFSLTRQGDILYFDKGSLRFTRRFGKWQYWNHSYMMDILENKARAQHVKQEVLGKVVTKLYKYAMDISFRHSGGLFVLLRNANTIHQVVRERDALNDTKRSLLNTEFERFLQDKTILGLDRNVILELASIDGALVFSNHGKLLAYGAVLEPKKRKHVQKEEGSRSKAAVGASHFGLSLKISSDGAISLYQDGTKFIEV